MAGVVKSILRARYAVKIYANPANEMFHYDVALNEGSPVLTSEAQYPMGVRTWFNPITAI
jgi:hypothetical protein